MGRSNISKKLGWAFDMQVAGVESSDDLDRQVEAVESAQGVIDEVVKSELERRERKGYVKGVAAVVDNCDDVESVEDAAAAALREFGLSDKYKTLWSGVDDVDVYDLEEVYDRIEGESA